mmetsp:Transcript_14297/g.21651  ORF Transcript_14297/g.21651 Transcript_14297/m.21651 type:complete len:97 (+) Transcript_14297:201-491(+)
MDIFHLVEQEGEKSSEEVESLQSQPSSSSSSPSTTKAMKKVQAEAETVTKGDKLSSPSPSIVPDLCEASDVSIDSGDVSREEDLSVSACTCTIQFK